MDEPLEEVLVNGVSVPFEQSEGVTRVRLSDVAVPSTYSSGPPPAPRLEVRDGGRGPWVAVSPDGTERVLIERSGEAQAQ